MQLQRYTRPAALVLLAAVTAYGLAQFLSGDWSLVRAYWQEQLWWIPVILLLASIDVALEGVGWAWIYHRFGIEVRDWAGMSAYLAGRAGLLLPAQLGRLIRPNSVSELGRGGLSQCLKAEAVVFVLDAASVVALIAALLVYLVAPLLAPVAGIAVIAILLALGNVVVGRVLGSRLSLPPRIWWSWQTFAIVLIQLTGWVTNGIALWFLLRHLGGIPLAEVLLFAAGSSLLGVGSGLPGGIGATEFLLGVSLRVSQVPMDQLFVVVTAFRLVTFWIWIPVGWAALVATRRRTASLQAPLPEVEPACSSVSSTGWVEP